MPPSNLLSLSNLLCITWMTSPYPVAWPNQLLWVINTFQAQKEVMDENIGVRALRICFSTSGDILRHQALIVPVLKSCCLEQFAGSMQLGVSNGQLT